MANLTKAEKHNRMMDRVYDTYKKQQEAKKDMLPTITEYTFFLGKAIDKFKITANEARDKYGLYTYGEWKELLKLF